MLKEIILNVDILKTIYFNLSVFPLKIALKIPVLLYKKTIVKGLYKGCVTVPPDIRRFSVKLGRTQFDPFSNSLLAFEDGAKLHFLGMARIDRGFNITINKGATFIVGEDVRINQNIMVACFKHIEIKNRTRISWNCQLLDSDFHYIYNQKNCSIKNNKASVIIGENCWIGNHVFFNKNAIIPNYTIIASNSMINKNFLEQKQKGLVLAGIPAKIVNDSCYRLFDWEKEKELDSFFLSSNSNELEILLNLNDLYKA